MLKGNGAAGAFSAGGGERMGWCLCSWEVAIPLLEVFTRPHKDTRKRSPRSTVCGTRELKDPGEGQINCGEGTP